MGKVEIAALVILAIIVLLFGAKKLPKLAKSIGQAGRELKNGFKDAGKTVKDEASK